MILNNFLVVSYIYYYFYLLVYSISMLKRYLILDFN